MVNKDPSFKEQYEKEKEPLIDKDKISHTIKVVDDYIQTAQEFIVSCNTILLKNEKTVVGISFSAGLLIAWLVSSCTTMINITTSHIVLISLLIFVISLLLISTKILPLDLIAIMVVSTIFGWGSGEIIVAWDSNTWMVVANPGCENPLKARDFAISAVSFAGGCLYIGKRYKLF